MLIPTYPWCIEKNGLEILFCITRPLALISQWDERSKVLVECKKLMSSLGAASLPLLYYWHFCGLRQFRR